MLQSRFYNVAGHVFEVRADDSAGVFRLMDNYRPFEEISLPGGVPAFSLEVACRAENVEYAEETRQVEESQEIICGKTLFGQSVFEFHSSGIKAGVLVCNEGFRDGTLYLQQAVDLQRFALNNGLMVFFALSTALEGTALFHSAVVVRDGVGYMFLGKSGTGKSTHARLWRQRFSDVELLNDDNPVVRLEEDGAWVYGSPWSGKTPCYKNARARLGAVVDLRQAARNKIYPLRGIEAYLSLVYSISGMRWNRSLADGLHATENRLAQEIPMFRLECLPDENAAEVCYEGVRNF